tara:strand:+ start:13161 stop:13349 length:189 start_codon:yes stop_codon:yes gene_type:complete
VYLESEVFSMVISPANLDWTPPIVLNKVDFPIPLTPTIAASSPCTKAKEIPFAIAVSCFLLL